MSSSNGKSVARAGGAWVEPLEGRQLLSTSYVPNELLVQFAPGVADAATAAVRSLLSAGLKERIGRARPGDRGAVELFSLPDHVSAESAAARLRGHPAVTYAEPNHYVYPAVTPNDPSFDQQWGLHNTGRSGGTADADIDAPEAWNVTTGSDEVVVFVIDSGVDYNHPDLAANMWRNPGEVAGDGIDNDGNGYVDDVHGINAIADSGNPMDSSGHGTHVAGIIGAVGNNGRGVSGVAWNVKIGAAVVLGTSGTVADIIQSLDYVHDLRARGVNVVATNNSYVSAGGWNWAGPFGGSIWRDAVDGPAGVDKILHVSAAGNENMNNDGIADHPVNAPAAWNLDNILGVAATDRRDRMASFSNWGATSVDLAAPGVEVYSTLPNNSYGSRSGTSMATPHVTGAAALAAALRPGISAESIKQALMDGADPVGHLGSNGAKPTVTNGRLNARNTLVNLSEGDTTAPAAVTDLAVSSDGVMSLTLSWTATGDDGTAGGAARAYDVRYSTSPIIDDVTWGAAKSAVVEPRPASPGTAESFRVPRLAPETSYYFAMKVRDDVGNESRFPTSPPAPPSRPALRSSTTGSRTVWASGPRRPPGA